MSHRSYNQRDANQAEIVAVLRERGAVVVDIERPVDLLVGYNGEWSLVEVKSGPRAKIQPSQKKFLAQCEQNQVPCILMFSPTDVDYWFPVKPQNVGTGGKNCESLPEDSGTSTAEQSATAEQEVDSG